MCKLVIDEYSQKKEGEGRARSQQRMWRLCQLSPQGLWSVDCITGVPLLRSRGQHLCCCVSQPLSMSWWGLGGDFLWPDGSLQGRGYLSSQHLHLKQLEISAPAQEKRSGQSLHRTHDSQLLSPPLCLPSTHSPVCHHQHPQNVISATPWLCDLKQVAQPCLTCKTDCHTSCRVILKITFGDSPECPSLSAFIKCQSPLTSCFWQVSLLPRGRWQLRTDAWC